MFVKYVDLIPGERRSHLANNQELENSKSKINAPNTSGKEGEDLVYDSEDLYSVYDSFDEKGLNFP